MPQVSRPLLAVLAAAILLLAVWIVALRPGGSSVTSGTRAAVTPAPVAAATHAAGAHAAATHRSQAAHATHGFTPAHSASATRSGKPAAVSAPQRVLQAVRSHHVVLVLFYNPSAREDRALSGEMDALNLPPGVVKATARIGDLADYQVITRAVTINQSPTFVLVDRKGQLSTITGYADPFELSTRVGQALAGR